MDIDSICTQIEEDLTWRLDEIRFFTAQLNNFKPLNMGEEEKQKIENKRVENDQKRFRKALVLMLYAHFEGFFRFSFKLYVDTINEEKINLSEAIEVLVASSLHTEFGNYDNLKELVNQESSVVNKAVKHLERRVNLIQEIERSRRENKVKLPISNIPNDKNSVIYTESNLKFDVIEKILYRLGFSTDIFKLQISGKTFQSALNEFLGRRNAIAHGDGTFKDGVDEKPYNEFKQVFEQVTNLIPQVITNALREKLYLKEEFR